MKKCMGVIILSFLGLIMHTPVCGAAAMATEEHNPAVRRRITQDNSTLFSYEAARHAHLTLMERYNGDERARALVRSSYAVNLLEYGCLGTPEGPVWKLRGSNKKTNREILHIMATISYPSLFEWEPGAIMLSANEPWVSFSAEYKPHAPRTAEEIAYVARLKSEDGIQQAIDTYHQLTNCVPS